MRMTLAAAAALLAAASTALAGSYEAPLDSRGKPEARFTTKPSAAKDGVGARIGFEVSAATDVEVAILDAKGAVVRHLAAGLLGKNAPEPLKKDALKQELAWDGRDDAGRPATGGPFKVRVRLGSAARLEKYAGWDGTTLGSSVVGLAVGKLGELYVLDSDRGWGRSGLRVFGPDGKYRRTIVPFPAGTPKARAAGVHALEIDGGTVPMVANPHCGNLLPLFSGMKTQTMAWNPKGHLVLFSAVGTIAEHGPPRHLLALHGEGGAPEGTAFAGPEIRGAIGFMGGAGERDSNFYEHLAVSPDGEHVYFTSYKLGDKNERHAVFRVKWTDKSAGAPFLGRDREAGADDAHLNNPQGLAVDMDGRLYVCDRGNNRVMVFDKEGKLLGKFAAEHPYQVAVHRVTSEIYVLGRKRAETKREKIPPVRITKFPAWPGSGAGELKELGRIEAGVADMALDPESVPARIWGDTGRGIVPIAEEGGKFTVGEPITGGAGLRYPLFVAGDPERGRAIVREKSGGLVALDLASGKISALPIKGTDAALDRAGNIYVMDGYGTNSLSRYTPEGKPLPFEALGSNKLPTGVYRGYGPNMGLRGHCVAPGGEIYVLRSNNYGLEDGTAAKVDVFGPDGRKLRTAVDGLGHGDTGLAVDAAGNVYVGANLRPKDKPLPEPFAGKVLDVPFVWWRKLKREPPWHYLYCHPYYFDLGAVLKFGPEGGRVWGNGGNGYKGQPPELADAAKAPAGATEYRSAYLARTLKVEGLAWRYAGYGPVPPSDCNWGDPACVCMTGHLAADGWGRVYAPNPFRFTVEMLDTAGNLLAHVGSYGNVDDAVTRVQGPGSSVQGSGSPSGPGTPNPEPGTRNPASIHFAWPTCVSEAGGKLFVSDVVNRRVAVIAFDYSAAEECALP